MKQKIIFLFAILLTALLTVLLANFLIYAEEQRGSSVAVMATVLPQRFIVVDKKLTIEQVLSNTAEDVRPQVFLERLDGPEIPYSDSIIKQYQAIRGSADFSRPGLVYQREPRPVMAFLKGFFQIFY